MALQNLKRPKKLRGYKQRIEAESKEETTKAQEPESAAAQQEPAATETDDATLSAEVEQEQMAASPDAAPSSSVFDMVAKAEVSKSVYKILFDISVTKCYIVTKCYNLDRR